MRYCNCGNKIEDVMACGGSRPNQVDMCDQCFEEQLGQTNANYQENNDPDNDWANE